MMTSNNVSSSSLLELKAELLRKKEEFRQQKLNAAATNGYLKRNVSAAKPAKKTIWSISNAGVKARAERDVEAIQEERDALAESRKALERKAKLYEQLSGGNFVPENSDSFNVDFEQKSLDVIAERRRKEEEERELEEEKKALEETVDESENPDEQWVDYTDLFGKPRRCLRKDLPAKVEKRLELERQKQTQIECKMAPDLLSKDMERERERQEWEKEQQEIVEKELDEVHYADVKDNEVRTHGVGFYQFAQTSEGRKEQLDKLNILREKTKDSRARQQELKDRRAKVLAERMAKVRMRRALAQGVSLEQFKADEQARQEQEQLIGPMPPEEKPKPELLKRDEEMVAKQAEKEWDKGKDTIQEWLSRDTAAPDYIEEKRNERLDEFAPPTALYGIKRLAAGRGRGGQQAGRHAFGAQPIRPEVKEIIDQVEQIGESPQDNADELDLDAMLSAFRDQGTADPVVPSTCGAASDQVSDIPLPTEEEAAYVPESKKKKKKRSKNQQPHVIPDDPFIVPFPPLPPGWQPPSDHDVTQPQPSHYGSAPQQPSGAPAASSYRSVSTFNVPWSLPAPPTAGGANYQSQKPIVNTGERTQNKYEEMWKSQFVYRPPGGAPVPVAARLPFMPPNVQRDGEGHFGTVNFDPTKPPPSS